VAGRAMAVERATPERLLDAPALRDFWQVASR
jgi:hypothetical protein